MQRRRKKLLRYIKITRFTTLLLLKPLRCAQGRFGISVKSQLACADRRSSFLYSPESMFALVTSDMTSAGGGCIVRDVESTLDEKISRLWRSTAAILPDYIPVFGRFSRIHVYATSTENSPLMSDPSGIVVSLSTCRFMNGLSGSREITQQ